MYLFVSAAPFYEMEKNCNIEIAAQIARVSSSSNGTWLSYLPFTFDTLKHQEGLSSLVHLAFIYASEFIYFMNSVLYNFYSNDHQVRIF